LGRPNFIFRSIRRRRPDLKNYNSLRRSTLHQRESLAQRMRRGPRVHTPTHSLHFRVHTRLTATFTVACAIATFAALALL